jgi:hypothetical protein
MKIRTNVTDPEKKKKSGGTKLIMEGGREKRTYKPTSVETGDPAYGKPGSGTKINKILEHARKHKQDVIHHNGLSYRTGHTAVEMEPAKFRVEFDKPNPDLKKIKLIPPAKKGKSAAEVRAQGSQKKDTANPVPWVAGQGGGKGKSEGKKLGKKAVKNIRY